MDVFSQRLGILSLGPRPVLLPVLLDVQLGQCYFFSAWRDSLIRLIRGCPHLFPVFSSWSAQGATPEPEVSIFPMESREGKELYGVPSAQLSLTL